MTSPYCHNCGIHRSHSSPGCTAHGAPEPTFESARVFEIATGNEVKPNSDGSLIPGKLLDLTDEERAKMPPLEDADPSAPNAYATGQSGEPEKAENTESTDDSAPENGEPSPS